MSIHPWSLGLDAGRNLGLITTMAKSDPLSIIMVRPSSQFMHQRTPQLNTYCAYIHAPCTAQYCTVLYVCMYVRTLRQLELTTVTDTPTGPSPPRPDYLPFGLLMAGHSWESLRGKGTERGAESHKERRSASNAKPCPPTTGCCGLMANTGRLRR